MFDNIDFEDARRLAASIEERGADWCKCDQCNLARAFHAVHQQLKEMVEMVETSPKDLDGIEYNEIVTHTMHRSRVILRGEPAQEPNELNEAYALATVQP